MKMSMRSDGPGMREPSESEMNDWLANLREDGASEPADTPSDADRVTDRVADEAETGHSQPIGGSARVPAPAPPGSGPFAAAPDHRTDDPFGAAEPHGVTRGSGTTGPYAILPPATDQPYQPGSSGSTGEFATPAAAPQSFATPPAPAEAEGDPASSYGEYQPFGSTESAGPGESFGSSESFGLSGFHGSSRDPGTGAFASVEPYEADEQAAGELAGSGAYPVLGAPLADLTRDTASTEPAEATDTAVTDEPGRAPWADWASVEAATGAPEVAPVSGVAPEASDLTGAESSPRHGNLAEARRLDETEGAGDAGSSHEAEAATATEIGPPEIEPAAVESVPDQAGAPGGPTTGEFRMVPVGRRRMLLPARPPVEADETPVRALIGEQLRTPIVWCELEPGSCISWHGDREALGMADVRARAIAAGWRIDALGRLSCPQCQQTSKNFRTTHPVVPWNRAYALTMATREAARQGNFSYPQPAFYPR